MVLGATNRRDQLDEAVLRRFVGQYEVRSCFAGFMSSVRQVCGKVLVPHVSQPEMMMMIDDNMRTIMMFARQVPMPDAEQRRDILHVILKQFVEEFGEDGMSLQLRGSLNTPASQAARESDPTWQLADQTEGLSGDDLKQLCSRAVRLPRNEYFAAHRDGQQQGGVRPVECR